MTMIMYKINATYFFRPCSLNYRYYSGADLGGGGGGDPGGPDPPPPPLSYMKNDVMHTVIYAAFCMLPSLDLQDCTSWGLYRSNYILLHVHVY